MLGFCSTDDSVVRKASSCPPDIDQKVHADVTPVVTAFLHGGYHGEPGKECVNKEFQVYDITALSTGAFWGCVCFFLRLCGSCETKH